MIRSNFCIKNVGVSLPPRLTSTATVGLVTTRETTYVPAPLLFTHLSEEEALARSREFLARVSERRSVRQFSPEPVALELIENALRAAGTAPSGANQQPWTFVVVTDPALKERLRAAAEHEEDLLYAERASAEYLEALEPIGTTRSSRTSRTRPA